jgi:Domain of unknown function (DUF4838)
MPETYRKHILTLLAALIVSASMAHAAVDLVVDGKPRAQIVIAEKPARMARYAAGELQTYVEKLSGACLPIATRPSRSLANIFVGVSPHTEELGLKTEGLKYGAYRKASGKNWLALLGADKDYKPIEPWGRFRDNKETDRVDRAWDAITGHKFRNPFYVQHMWYDKTLDLWLFDDRGTLHAVHQFLESLGVRWYFPGEIGEIVPKLQNISVQANLNSVVKPDYNLRSFTWWSQPWGALQKDARWRLRLGIHHQHDTLGMPQVCHGMKFVHGRKEFQKAHPKAFALINGKRDTRHKRHGAPCLSSKLMFKEHVAYVRAMFDHFKEPIVSIDVVDGYSGRVCECTSCAGNRTPERGAPGALSNYVWNYYNRVAKEVYKSHPDKKVSAFSYGGYCLPPTNIKRMSPNLVVVLMSSRQYFAQQEHRTYIAKLIKDWKRVLPSGELYSFENISYNWKKRLVLPVYLARQSVDYFKATGDALNGYYFSIYEHRPWSRDKMTWDALGTAHLDIYILSKLLWNRNTDVEALLEEYCRLFYGPVRKEMRAFIDYCEANHPKMRTDVSAIDQALKLIGQAKARVKPGSVYGQRVSLIVDYVEQLKGLRENLAKPRTGPRIQLAGVSARNIKLDGRLTEPFWKDIPKMELRDIKTGQIPKVKTSVKMAWGEGNKSLYIGVHCAEPDMSGVTDTADGTLATFNGDNLDIHIETPIVDFYQLVISPSGKLLDMDRSGSGRMRFNTKWNSGATVKVHQGADFWSVEIQIPAGGAVARELDSNHLVAGEIPTQAAPWRFNMGRLRPRKDDKSPFSAYIPTLKSRFDDRFLRGSLVVK